MAHLRVQWKQSGHSECMMEGQGTETVAWTQEKKDFTDLLLGRVKESPVALGHQAKHSARSNLPSKKQSIVRDYVSCIMVKKYLFPFSAWRSTSLPHLQEGAGRFVQKTLQRKWGMAKQWERCTFQMDDNDSLTMVPMLEDTRWMWMHPTPKHINICCICCKATEISKIFLPQTHIEHVKHLFSGTWWQQTRSAAHWDQAARHRTSAQQPRHTARQWVKGSSQEWRTIADKCAFPFWNLSIAFPVKLPVHEGIHAPFYLWSIHPNRMWFSLIFICSCLLDFEVLDGHSEFWMKSRDWKCICHTSPSNEGWCPNFKLDLNGSHHKMNSITQDANSCLQVTEVLPSWHCDSDQTYPKISEIHTHIDGRMNMPYHDIAYLANNQQTTDTPFLQSKHWHCHSDLHDTIPPTPTPIFSTSRVSPCYWAAAVAEFVAIFHRCHAPPPPPWLTRLNTVPNQQICTTSSMTEVLPYFLQFSLLRVFSIKIPKRASLQKTEDLSQNFRFLSAFTETDTWRIRGQSSASMPWKTASCISTEENAPPIYGMIFSSRMNLSVFYQMWLDDQMRFIMCTLASKLWVRFRPRHLQRPPEVTWVMRYC